VIKSLIQDTWEWYWSLAYEFRHMVSAGIAAAVFATIFAWKIMIPFWILAVLVAGYLRYSRGKDFL
jgi:hypothetical protein